MSNIAFLFLPLAFSSLPAVLPFRSPSSQVTSSFLLLVAGGFPCWKKEDAVVFCCFARSSDVPTGRVVPGERSKGGKDQVLSTS